MESTANSITSALKVWTGGLANVVEVIAAIIIGVAVIEATIRALGLFGSLLTKHSIPAEAKETLRLRLGRWLAVALEFELAADILRTAIAPTFNEIGLLAAVAAIRTGLNFFLEREISNAASREAERRGSDNPSAMPVLTEQRPSYPSNAPVPPSVKQQAQPQSDQTQNPSLNDSSRNGASRESVTR